MEDTICLGIQLFSVFSLASISDGGGGWEVGSEESWLEEVDG